MTPIQIGQQAGMPAPGAPMVHPVWCDPTLCSAPDRHPAEYESHGWAHHSNPIELDGSISGAFGWDVHFETPPAVDASGAWAWLTQSIAPWHCATYLNIGFYTSGRPAVGARVELPRYVFRLAMQVNHMAVPSRAMSGGERLAHLATYALETELSDLNARVKTF